MNNTSTTHQGFKLAGLWKSRRLIGFNVIVLLLITTWLVPSTRFFWDILDQKAFLALNKWIQTNPYWQTFWAMANHKNTDWLFDAIILYFIGSYIYHAPSHLKLRRLCEVTFTIILTASTILLVNRFLFRDIITIYRESPSLVTPMATLLNTVVPWMETKTSARFSFPGDHATTALMFIFAMNLLLDRPKAFFATLIGIFFILPRLIIGAHWLTDILIGSLSITMFIIAWTFYTPLYHTFVTKMENILRTATKRKT
ncbi:MAG: phosphatase PAP2 family protein [Rhabdochlamydiaceae bacterium]|nr:phosphatase PAP2 family protein [Candidatus Amphrikana amoebophyrae]